MIKPFTILAHIHSKKGEFDQCKVIKYESDNDIVVEYGGVNCTAIFNAFTCSYYVDDIFGIIKEKKI